MLPTKASPKKANDVRQWHWNQIAKDDWKILLETKEYL